MTRNGTAALFLGVCVALTACEKTVSDDLAGPETDTPIPHAEVAALVAPRANYIATNLSNLLSFAESINDNGQVVGSYLRAGYHPFIWQGGVLRDLSPNGPLGVALAVNASGQVVGQSDGPNGYTAAIWRNGVLRNLGTLGWNSGSAPGGASAALGINAGGKVVGYSLTADGATRAFIWDGTSMKKLAGLGTVYGKAYGIDLNGRIAGEFGGSSIRGFRWQTGTVTSLTGTATARTINNEGKVVGWLTTTSGAPRAYLWRSGVRTDLGTLGGSSSAAYGINGLGHIVGESNTSDGRSHVFLWKNGVMYDVGPGNGRGINGNGWIAGFRIDPAHTGHTTPVAALWKPTGSPPPPPPPGLVRVGNTFFASARNGSYNEAVDTVAVGRTVTWDWFGGTHNIRSLGSPSFTRSASLSGADAKYTRTFTVPGTYRYDCSLHSNTMTGRIVVR
jgi:probable HAF family extracellular repeat protein